MDIFTKYQYKVKVIKHNDTYVEFECNYIEDHKKGYFIQFLTQTINKHGYYSLRRRTFNYKDFREIIIKSNREEYHIIGINGI